MQNYFAEVSIAPSQLVCRNDKCGWMHIEKTQCSAFARPWGQPAWLLLHIFGGAGGLEDGPALLRSVAITFLQCKYLL